ncbi:MAG: TadE/TadG family type IV pilus assembly protein [Litorimonas sp.]
MLLNKFGQNESGAMSVGFGGILFTLMLSTGMAIDVSRAYSYSQNMQNALDASTLHAAQNIRNEDFQQNAQGFFKDNFNKTNISNIQSQYSVETEFVRGTANGQLPLFFGKFLGRDTLPISVSAAVSVSSAPACIVALQTRNGAGITLNSGANVTSPECGLEVHSTRNPAFIINSGVTLEVPQTCIASDRIVDNNGAVDNIQTSCAVNPDPYLGEFEEPDSSHCDYRNTNFNEANITLHPGVYCGYFNFNNSNTKVHFTGGEEPYILRGGSWNVNGGEWSGDNVSFYFADAQSRLQFNSGVKATLTPPTSGPYEGVFITETPGLRNSQFIINDSRGFDFEGIIYLPSREIILNSGATVRSRELSLVARSFIINGANLNLETPGLGPSQTSTAYISQ